MPRLKRSSERSCGSDITLGDFWGIQTAHPEVDYEGGFSAVLCNTAKGAAAFDALAVYVESGPSSLEKVLPGNPSLVRSVVLHARRDAFMADLASGASIEALMARYDFRPALRFCVRSVLSRIKRKLAGVFWAV